MAAMPSPFSEEVISHYRMKMNRAAAVRYVE